jgi:hypothetical protein
MIESLPAPTPIRQEDRVNTYLLALGSLCLELARAPQLLPVFLRVIALAPRTIAELRTTERRGVRGRSCNVQLRKIGNSV